MSVPARSSGSSSFVRMRLRETITPAVPAEGGAVTRATPPTRPRPRPAPPRLAPQQPWDTDTAWLPTGCARVDRPSLAPAPAHTHTHTHTHTAPRCTDRMPAVCPAPSALRTQWGRRTRALPSGARWGEAPNRSQKNTNDCAGFGGTGRDEGASIHWQGAGMSSTCLCLRS